jgi:hypothetical protein
MTNMPWIFAVVFMSVFAVLVTFAVIWLMSQGPMHRHK